MRPIWAATQGGNMEIELFPLAQFILTYTGVLFIGLVALSTRFTTQEIVSMATGIGLIAFAYLF